MKVAKFSGEEISTDPTKVRPQHLDPNDAMLFFQILRACDASLIYGSDPITLRATWEEPFTRTSRQAVIAATLNELAGDDAELTKAAAIAGYADALIHYDQSSGPQARLAVLREAKANVSAALEGRADADLEEIQELLTTYSETLP